MQAIRVIRSIPGVVSGAAIVLALWFMAPSASADSVMKGIKPGPTEQSAAEKSIEADPANGIEHAVILIEEYERDESPGTNGKTHYHLRAKILSNEGRDLADVVIPGLDRSSKIVDWWGRTIQPDGTVQELAQDELESQLAASSRGGGDIEDVKAALPGVVAGSVIDYGYTVRGAGFYSYDRVPLQRRYSTREFRYAWRPFKGQQGAYFLSRTENLNVKHEVDGRDIVVQGRNLPAARDEMLMPPRDAARAMLYLYYVPIGTQFKTYWEDLARGMTSLIDSTYKKASARKAIEQIRLAPEGSLDDKLRALYTWVGENIVREGLQSFEERREEDDEDEKQRRDNVRQLMEVRSGSIFDVHTFFIALARALGAEANLVYAADRTQNYWNPQMRTFRQFGSTLVAVGPKGAKPE